MNLKQTPIALLFLTATIFVTGLQAQDESKQKTRTQIQESVRNALQAQDEPKQKTGENSDLDEILIVYLEHLDAKSGVELVDRLVGGGAKITANVRTNSLIISGTKDRNELIKNIIAKLDVAETRNKNKKPNSHFMAYRFENRQSLESGFKILSAMLSNEPIKMDFDRNGLKLFLRGTEQHHKIAQSVFDKIDQPPSESDEKNIHISTILIVDQLENKDDDTAADFAVQFKELNGELKSAIDKANEKGLLQMSNPVVASRISSLVNSSPTGDASNKAKSANGQFSNRSTGFFSLANSGKLTKRPSERYNVANNIIISVEGNTLELSSNVELPINHPVMLSFSTLQSSFQSHDAVVVIMLTTE